MSKILKFDVKTAEICLSIIAANKQARKLNSSFKPLPHWCTCFSLAEPSWAGKQIGQINAFKVASNKGWAISFTEN